MKRFVGLARVSSREQEREGFSLQVQEDALRRYATSVGGEIIRLFRIAETASKSDERRTFKEMLAFTKRSAGTLDGMLFYKVDRAVRNLYDLVELERLESEEGVPFISVSQPTESNPAGRMMRRTLANMASFYTEQQSVDVREGLARRVEEGWFVGKPPYGYRNVRTDGRSTTVVDADAAANVKRIFQLFGYHALTLDGLVERLAEEGAGYKPGADRFPRSKLHTILRDRAYIGELPFKGQWMPGKHQPLVDRATWERVQSILGGHVYRAHDMTFASEAITCGHCGHPITGERKTKATTNGERAYVYYRCSRYNKPGHPRARVTETELDGQLLSLFDRMRVRDQSVRDWFHAVLEARTKEATVQSTAQRSDLQRQESSLNAQQDRLLNLRLEGEIDPDTFARKQTELRDRLAQIRLKAGSLDRPPQETADLARRVFELSQTLKQRWVTADYTLKRRILEIVCLNCRLDGASLVVQTRKPFDMLVEGLLVPSSRGGGI